MEDVIDCNFCSVWNDGAQAVELPAKLDISTGRVFDIDIAAFPAEASKSMHKLDFECVTVSGIDKHFEIDPSSDAPNEFVVTDLDDLMASVDRPAMSPGA
jgi:hypothetical protein